MNNIQALQADAAGSGVASREGGVYVASSKPIAGGAVECQPYHSMMKAGDNEGTGMVAAGMSNTAAALTSGAFGASALTVLHESVRRMRPDAPRMDILGMRAIAGTMRAAGLKPPPRARLHTVTMLADLVSNGLYFSLIGSGRNNRVWMRGALLGLAAGIGGVVLPPPMGLGSRPSGRTPQTKAMTAAWYVTGGLAAAALARLLSRSGG